MHLGFILIVLAYPLLELAVLIKVGQSIGFWWTVLLLIGTGLIGTVLVQRQGLDAMWRAMDAARRGEAPVEPMVDSMFLVLAGILLAIPGLISDALACVLLIPPVRHAIARWAIRRLLASGRVHVERRTWETRTGPQQPGDGSGRRSGGDGVVIEGEWERVDEPPPKRPRMPPETKR